MNNTSKALFLLMVFLLHFSAFGIRVELESTTRISDEVLLESVIDFCVTEDDLAIMLDYKAGDLKIYNNRGKLVNTVGRKGYGPDEFAEFHWCCYSDGKLVIADSGQRKIFFYDRKGKTDFIRSKEIFANYMGYDAFLRGKTLFLTGPKITNDEEYYSFYAFNIETGKDFVYYLPSYLQFGLDSVREYKNEVFKKPDLTTIGIRSMFDIQGDFAYYIWQGDLKIFKINLKTKEISTFGQKMPHYVKPYCNQKLLNAYYNRQGNYVQRERSKMSYVIDIFTTPKYVIVIYRMAAKDNDIEEYMVQFYSLDGKFIEEIALPGKASVGMWFVQQTSTLYTIIFEADAQFKESQYMIKYKIH